MVNGLRVFARADKGEPEVFCINDRVANAISLVREIFAKSGITLTSDLGETWLFCRGEFGRLAQVIMNLLSNARDALEGSEGRGLT